jgi:hypothetical protein
MGIYALRLGCFAILAIVGLMSPLWVVAVCVGLYSIVFPKPYEVLIIGLVLSLIDHSHGNAAAGIIPLARLLVMLPLVFGIEFVRDQFTWAKSR